MDLDLRCFLSTVALRSDCTGSARIRTEGLDRVAGLAVEGARCVTVGVW